METKEVHVGTRIPQTVYKRLLQAQKDAKKKTGFEVSISEIVRRAIEAQYPGHAA
jgi:hypothetical protein